MYSRKIYATVAATGNAIANIVVPSKSRLVGVQWAFTIDAIADNVIVAVELSRASATEINVNAAQQCISELRFQNNLVTSGMQLTNANFFFPVDVPFDQGQIIYLHCVITGTATFTGGATMWLR